MSYDWVESVRGFAATGCAAAETGLTGTGLTAPGGVAEPGDVEPSRAGSDGITTGSDASDRSPGEDAPGSPAGATSAPVDAGTLVGANALDGVFSAIERVLGWRAAGRSAPARAGL